MISPTDVVDEAHDRSAKVGCRHTGLLAKLADRTSTAADLRPVEPHEETS